MKSRDMIKSSELVGSGLIEQDRHQDHQWIINNLLYFLFIHLAMYQGGYENILDPSCSYTGCFMKNVPTATCALRDR